MDNTRTTEQIRGIHHITAISGSAAVNLDFYTRVLGLRLVKKTVNFDDPGTYHLYYGDKSGRPGTILTFFPWQSMPQGRQGTGQLSAVGFSVPENTVPFWSKRLAEHGVATSSTTRFNEPVIRFTDPHGLPLELIGTTERLPVAVWDASPVAPDLSIRGFHLATAVTRSVSETADFLEKVMGMQRAGSEANRMRFEMAVRGEAGRYYDIVEDPHAENGIQGIGTFHHIAFRAADDRDQKRWRSAIASRKLNVTEVIDRKYFRSIYFRETGGVLFEIATDPPGFTVDESEAELGRRLMLPKNLEPLRSQLEKRLPPLSPPPQFEHVYLPPADNNMSHSPFVALHGFGGNENDLLPLAREIGGSGRAVLSLRGQVRENGMNRFFERLPDGSFDVADILRRVDKLAEFLSAAVRKYNVDPMGLTAVGYSNGANMAAATLLVRPEVFDAAVLFRPMLPLMPQSAPDLSGKRILVIRGRHDTVIPKTATIDLVDKLREFGAQTTLVALDSGHQLTHEDIKQAKRWLEGAEVGRVAAAV